ncbi:MAG: efflux RND transporter periplasmic adaptor subunit, partial [Blastocatellia bacterium]
MLRQKLVCGLTLLSIATLLLLSSACSKTPAATQPHPPEVEVTPVEQKDMPIYSEWIGTLDGRVNADIKAEVSGYLLTRNYTEGSYV